MSFGCVSYGTSTPGVNPVVNDCNGVQSYRVHDECVLAAIAGISINGVSGPTGPDCNGVTSSLAYDACSIAAITQIGADIVTAIGGITGGGGGGSGPVGPNCNGADAALTYDVCVRDAITALNALITTADANNTAALNTLNTSVTGIDTAITTADTNNTGAINTNGANIVTAVNAVLSELTAKLVQAANCDGAQSLLTTDPCILAAVNTNTADIVAAINALNATNSGRILQCAAGSANPADDGRLIIVDISVAPAVLTELDGTAVPAGVTAVSCGGGGGGGITGNDCNGVATNLSYDQCVEIAVNTAATSINTSIADVVTAINTTSAAEIAAGVIEGDKIEAAINAASAAEIAAIRNPVTDGRCYSWVDGANTGEFFGYIKANATGDFDSYVVLSGTAPPAGAVVSCLTDPVAAVSYMTETYRLDGDITPAVNAQPNTPPAVGGYAPGTTLDIAAGYYEFKVVWQRNAVQDSIVTIDGLNYHAGAIDSADTRSPAGYTTPLKHDDFIGSPYAGGHRLVAREGATLEVSVTRRV